jgi:radical SAM superfamily enzyme YgiQ (UPF0313 family)
MRLPGSLLKHKSERPRYAMFPFFLAHTAALLERNGFDVGVVDGVPLNLTEEELESRVRQHQPDVILFEPNTAVIDDTIALARRLRQGAQPLIVLAGTHASVFARQLLEAQRRGCPFRCNFRSRVQVLYRSGPQRFRPADQVVDEMESLRDRCDAREIYFDDDSFTSHRKNVLGLCAERRSRKWGLSWFAMADAMGLDEGLLAEMAVSGCIGIEFGLDSADTRVLKPVGKPLKTERLEAIVAKAKSLGVKTHLSMVLGLAGETAQSLETTLAYCNRIDVESIQFSLATPCPGTAWFDDLVREGDLQVVSWDEFDGANASLVHCEGLPRKQLEEAMAQEHSQWLRSKVTNPRWLARQGVMLSRSARTLRARGVMGRVRRAARLIAGGAARVQIASAERSLRS